MFRLVGYLNIIISIAHLIGLFWADKMFEYTGISNEMRELSLTHQSLPYLLTIVVSIAFLIFGLYALSAHGDIRAFPLLRTAIYIIAIIYILRGLGGIINNIVMGEGVAQYVFSVVAFAIGLLYLIGALRKWNFKKDKR